jgi:hypothetical protein
MIAAMLAWPAAARTTYATRPTERSSQNTTTRRRPKTCTTDAASTYDTTTTTITLVIAQLSAVTRGIPTKTPWYTAPASAVPAAHTNAARQCVTTSPPRRNRQTK